MSLTRVTAGELLDMLRLVPADREVYVAHEGQTGPPAEILLGYDLPSAHGGPKRVVLIECY